MPEPIVFDDIGVPLPVSERIVVYVAALLRGITADAGYCNDVVVCRYRPDGNAKGAANATLMIVLDEAVPTDAPEVAPGTLAGYRMPIDLFFYSLNASEPGDQDEQAVGRFTARAHADIRKVLETDRNLGGLAMVATLQPPDGGWSLGEIPATRLPLNVVFWTRQDDPYALR